MQIDSSVVEDSFLGDMKGRDCTLGRREQVDIVQVSEASLVRLHGVLDSSEGRVERCCEKARHEWVALLPSFTLVDGVGLASSVVPDVGAGRRIELAHIREKFLEGGVPVEGSEDGCAGDVVISPDAIDADDGCGVIDGQPRANGSCESLGPSACGERELVGGTGCVERATEGLGQGAGEEASEGISEDQTSHAAIPFTQGHHAAEAKGAEDRSRDRRVYETLGGVVEEGHVFLRVEKDPEVCVRAPGRAGGGASTGTSQVGGEEIGRQGMSGAGIAEVRGRDRVKLVHGPVAEGFEGGPGGVGQRLRREGMASC